jgi:hypothetical protein
MAAEMVTDYARFVIEPNIAEGYVFVTRYSLEGKPEFRSWHWLTDRPADDDNPDVSECEFMEGLHCTVGQMDAWSEERQEWW